MRKLFFNVFVLVSISLIISCGNTESQDNAINNEDDSSVAIEMTDEIANINGAEIFIQKMGKGEPFLVLHSGPGLFHDYLTPYFKKLAEKYQIIFYDQRGCGKSAFPSDTSSINMDNFIEDIEALRAHLKIEKLNLIGHSFGSVLAVNYGKKYPNNLERLILVAPAPSNSNYFDETFNNMQARRSDEDTKALIQAMMSKEFEDRDPVVFKKTVLLGDKVNLVKQENIEELYKPISFTKENANNLLLVNSMMEKNFFDYNLTDGVEVITCPTIIIIGDLDNVPFASAQLIADHIKGARLEVIKKSCHYPFYEQPKEFNGIINDFLTAKQDNI